MTLTSEKEFSRKLGYVLKETRKAKKMKQPEVAKKLNVTKVTVSRWEKGDRNMSAKSLKEYCDVLGVSVQSVIDRTDEV